MKTVAEIQALLKNNGLYNGYVPNINNIDIIIPAISNGFVL